MPLPDTDDEDFSTGPLEKPESERDTSISELGDGRISLLILEPTAIAELRQRVNL